MADTSGLWSGIVDTSSLFGTGFDGQRTPDTVASNALQSSQPVEAPSNDNAFSGFFGDLAKTLVGAGVNAYKSNQQNSANAQQYAQQQAGAVNAQRLQQRQVLFYAGIGLVALLIIKA